MKTWNPENRDFDPQKPVKTRFWGVPDGSRTGPGPVPDRYNDIYSILAYVYFQTLGGRFWGSGGPFWGSGGPVLGGPGGRFWGPGPPKSADFIVISMLAYVFYNDTMTKFIIFTSIFHEKIVVFSWFFMIFHCMSYLYVLYFMWILMIFDDFYQKIIDFSLKICILLIFVTTHLPMFSL